MSETWKPERTVQLIAGTPPGGGLDRVAQALAKAITDARLLDVPVEVVNVPGDGARRAWTHYIDHHEGDGHVIGISSPNLTSDYFVGIAGFEHSKYSPIATLITEYIAFAARPDSSIATAADLLKRLGDAPASLTVALSTALGTPNHVALAKLLRHAGGDINAPTIRVFDTALDAVGDVVAGQADICAVTAASVIGAMNAGTIRPLAISAPSRLSAPLDQTPTWNEAAVDCVVGAWRGATGPRGMPPVQMTFWEGVLKQAVQQPVWQSELQRLSWSPMFLSGDELNTYLASERDEFVAVLKDIGLLRMPPTAQR